MADPIEIEYADGSKGILMWPDSDEWAAEEEMLKELTNIFSNMIGELPNA